MKGFDECYYCDKCGKEHKPEELYVVDDDEVCEVCILNKYDTVAQVEERRFRSQYVAEFLAHSIKA